MIRAFDQKYYNLLREITITQFKLKDQRTFLGLVWSFLHPLFVLGLLFVVFNIKFAERIEHFPIYLLIGIVHITHFSMCTSSSMSILVRMKNLTVNTTFPKETLVMASVIANTFEFILSLMVCIMIAFFSGVALNISIVLSLMVILMQTMFVLWVSLLLSCLYVFIADINHIYQVFLRMLFFITPVFYDLSFLDNGIAKNIALANPLTHLMSLSRNLILSGQFASFEFVGWFLLVNSALVVIALRVFRRFEPNFAERL